MAKSKPAEVQKPMKAWYMTLDYIKANPDKAVQIMSKRAGVSPAEYKDYDAGTTLFTLQQNIDAFKPGSDLTHLDYASRKSASSSWTTSSSRNRLSTTGVFEPKFIEGYKQ